MNLRESLKRDGDGMDNPTEGREVFLWASGLVHGYGTSAALDLAISTDGEIIQIHNLSADTRSAPIWRQSLRTTHDVLVAVRAQLDALPYWRPEADDWGPDPWKAGRKVGPSDA